MTLFILSCITAIIVALVGLEIISFQQEFIIICAFVLLFSLVIGKTKLPLYNILANYSSNINEQFKRDFTNQNEAYFKIINDIQTHLTRALLYTHVIPDLMIPLKSNTIHVKTLAFNYVISEFSNLIEKIRSRVKLCI